MKEVILHVGMHKTGSTSIQEALEGYSSRGTKYASFNHPNHSVPMYTIFSEDRNDYYIWRRMALTAGKIEKKKNGFLEILRNDLEQAGIDRLIISGEGISDLSKNDQVNLVRFFEAAGFSVKIIMYVREPHKFAVSWNQQIAKNRIKQVSKAINPNYRNRLEGFVSALPKQNIRVFDFDTVVENTGLVSHFSALLNIDLEEPKFANESLSLQALSLAYCFNNAATIEAGKSYKWLAYRQVIDEIRSVFSIANGCDRLDENFGHSLLSPETQAQCDWLKEQFGIRYTCAKNKSGTDGLVEALKNCLDGHTDKLFNLFKNLQFAYNPGISLAENFQFAHRQICAQILMDEFAKIQEPQNKNSTTREFRDKASIALRDVALRIERKEEFTLYDALSLMKLAQTVRPKGPLINRKIEEWSHQLGYEDDD